MFCPLCHTEFRGDHGMQGYLGDSGSDAPAPVINQNFL
jgi:hypothetical protein